MQADAGKTAVGSTAAQIRAEINQLYRQGDLLAAQCERQKAARGRALLVRSLVVPCSGLFLFALIMTAVATRFRRGLAIIAVGVPVLLAILVVLGRVRMLYDKGVNAINEHFHSEFVALNDQLTDANRRLDTQYQIGNS